MTSHQGHFSPRPIATERVSNGRILLFSLLSLRVMVAMLLYSDVSIGHRGLSGFLSIQCMLTYR